MKKKIMALAMTAVLAMSTVLPAAATSAITITSPTATTVEVTGATDGDGNELLYFSSEEEAEAYYEANPDAVDEDGGYGYLVVTDSDTSPNLEDEDVQDLIQEIIDAEQLIHESTGDSVEVEDVVVHSLFEVYWVDKGVKVNFPITITFNVPGVTASNFVDVLSYNEDTGAWERHEATAGDGTVTVTFTHFCYVAILVSSTESDDDITDSDGGSSSTDNSGTGTGTSDGTSSQTGDISIAIPVTLLIVAGAAIVVLVVRGRKKEAE